MHVVIEGASVGRYGQYGSEGSPLNYERGQFAGQPIEYVDLLVPAADGTVETLRATLDPTINGSRPTLGVLVDVRCRVKREDQAIATGDGKARIVQKWKWRAVEFAEVAARSK
jgi:hypothetical protein